MFRRGNKDEQPPGTSDSELASDMQVVSCENPPAYVHQSRKEKTSAVWDQHFMSLMAAYTEGEYPETFSCVTCGKDEQNIILCRDCIPHTYMCSSCVGPVHKYNILHKPVQWNDADHTYKPFQSQTEPALTRVEHSHCGSSYLRSIVLVNNEGFQSRVQIQFCNCEAEIATLVRHRFWAASPTNPSVAIQFGLMDSHRILVVESQLSIRSFFEALKWKHFEKIQNVVIIKELYRCITGESFEMYRRFVYTKSHLHHLCPQFDDGTSCPACPIGDEQKSIYSFDANFGLVRRKAAGTAVKEPFHSGHFFINQPTVDDFVEKYKTTNNEKGCSNFQAGSDLRSKNKNSKLAETGVFGACCRHEYPKAFFNLRHGERMANAVFLLNHLKKSNKNLIVLYDIACKLSSHLQKTDHSVLENVILGIPVFHCYGHQTSCQVKYSPRRIVGAGFTDGEAMERLWSFLRRFKKITKEMQSDHRTDLLVDGLMHFGEKLRMKMVPSFCQKLFKAAEAEKLYMTELSKVAPNTDFDEIEAWKRKEEDLLLKKRPNITKDNRWKEEYALKIHELLYFRDEEEDLPDDDARKTSFLLEVGRIEKALVGIEKRHHVSQRWTVDSKDYQVSLKSAVISSKEDKLSHLHTMAYEHMCLKEAMKKYADGQMISTRVSKQLKNLHRKIEETCTKYNKLPPVVNEFPCQITAADVKTLDSDLWATLQSRHRKARGINHQAIDIYCRIMRSREEQAMVKKEIHQVMNFHLSWLVFLDKFQIQSLLQTTSQHLLGAQALIKQHLYTKIGLLREMFEVVKDTIDISLYEKKLSVLSVSNEQPIPFCQSSESESESESDDDI